MKPSLQPELFTYSFPVRVYFENTDAGGVVYHAEYLKFMERARTEWLRHLGYDHQALARDHKVIFVVSAIAADFLKPARLDDNLDVSARQDDVMAGRLIAGASKLLDDIGLGSCQRALVTEIVRFAGDCSDVSPQPLDNRLTSRR